MSPFIICIDGLIGSGKSTLIQKLSYDYKCFPEPIEEWTLLPFLYKNLTRYGPAFQFQVLLSQFNQWQSFPKDNNFIIVERCPWTSRNIFAPLILDSDSLKTYNKMFELLSYNVNCFIYLDVDPENAFRRIHNRSSTDNLISLDYLRGLHETYRLNLLMGRSDVYVVNEGPPERVEETVRLFLTETFASIY